MDVSYWKKRWREGQTGWHHEEVHPILLEYYEKLELSRCSHFFYPLSGKTLDIDFLLSKGHSVTCVEASDIAISEIGSRLNLAWDIENKSLYETYRSQKLTIYKGDYFHFTDIQIPKIDVAFDRGAFVAIDPLQRQTYANIYKNLSPEKILLVLYRYDEKASTNPPFSFKLGEVNQYMEPEFSITNLESKDILDTVPKFKERNIDEFFRDVFICQKN